MVAGADGLQLGACEMVSAHHFANVLYNGLRGGLFVDHERFPRSDLLAFLEARHRGIVARHATAIGVLPETPTVDALRAAAKSSADPDLRRLALGDLPPH